MWERHHELLQQHCAEVSPLPQSVVREGWGSGGKNLHLLGGDVVAVFVVAEVADAAGDVAVADLV